MDTEDIAVVKRKYCRQLAGLSRDDLLTLQVEFEKVPVGRNIDWEVRLQQAICLGTYLVQRFGASGWQRPLEMRRKALMAHV